MHVPQINVLLNWRKEKNLTGKYSVYLCITLNRISKYYTIQLPEKVREDQWMGIEDAWVKKNHPFSFEINNKIGKKFALHELIKRCYIFNKSISLEAMLSHLWEKGNRSCFYDFMQNYIKRPPVIAN